LAANQSSASQPVFLQVASFTDQPRAQAVASSLQHISNQTKAYVETGYANNQPVYRVRVGPSLTRASKQYSNQITQIYPDTLLCC